jgi:hypothetical protein
MTKLEQREADEAAFPDLGGPVQMSRKNNEKGRIHAAEPGGRRTFAVGPTSTFRLRTHTTPNINTLRYAHYRALQTSDWSGKLFPVSAASDLQAR